MKKMLYALGTLFVLLQVVMGVRMDAFAKSYTQNISGSTKVTYTYYLESGSTSNVYVKKVTVTNPTSNMAFSFPEKIPETVNGKTKYYTITSIKEKAMEGISVSSIKLPMSLKKLEYKALGEIKGSLKTLYVPESIESVDDQMLGTWGGMARPLQNLYIRVSSTSNVKIDTPSKVKKYTDKMLVINNQKLDKNFKDNNVYVPCDSKGKPKQYGVVELFNSVSCTPFMDSICDKYAAELVSQLVPANASPTRKIQLLYNYSIETVRYSRFSSHSMSWVGSNQSAFGALFLHSAVCAGKTQAMGRLLTQAGIDSKYVNNDAHAWNVVSPNNNNEYYYLDTTANTCMRGRNGITGYEASDKYNMMNDYYDQFQEVIVDNKTVRNYKIQMYNTDRVTEKYLDYVAMNQNADEVVSVTSICWDKKMKAYVNPYTYYSFEIRDGSKTVLKEDIILNHAGVFTKKFKDSTGTERTLTVKKDSTYAGENLTKDTRFGKAFIITIE